MTTEVSDEIRKRIEARRAARGGTAPAPSTQEPAAPVVEPLPPSQELITPPAANGDGAAAQEPVTPLAVAPPPATPPSKPAGKRQPVREPEPATQAAPPEPAVEPVSRADRVTIQHPPQPAILSLLEDMRRGEAVVIVRDEDARWTMTTYQKFVSGPKPSTAPTGTLPNGFFKSLLSDEYVTWEAAWNKKTFLQKMESAVESGLNADDYFTNDKSGELSEQLTLLKLVPAVRAKLGMSKYRPAYQTITQRKEAEQKARAGEAW